MISDSSINIIRDICKLMTESGGECAQWRVCVADDVERHLFGDHGIARDYRWQICRRAESAEEARAIVQGFRNLSCDGCQGDAEEDESAVYVYAYMKRPLLEPAGR